jgi:hypothetical protein
MPIRFKDTGTVRRIHDKPFVGPLDFTVGIQVNLATLTNKEIDEYGYLKPGIPFQRNGTLVGAAPAFVFGVSVEEIKVADGNTGIAGLGTVEVAVATICQVNQSVATAILGRAYTANEIAGFYRAGSKCVLLGSPPA